MDKIKVAILGSGNIGTDLMYKLQKSSKLKLTTMIGIDPQSDGLRKAEERVIKYLITVFKNFYSRQN